MGNRNEIFGRLLRAGIGSIASYEGKTAPVIEEDLGQQLGVVGKTVQRYKTGYIPPEHEQVRILAEACVNRGLMGRLWLHRFLETAHYPYVNQLLDQLCPTAPSRPRPPRILQNLPAPTYSQFIMRRAAFAEVHEGLSKRSAAVIIVGLGGNGKTSLAREIADDCLRGGLGTVLFNGVVWVSDKDRPGTANLSVVLDEIARTLDYPGFTQLDHEEKRREIEQLLRRLRILVCVDNFETVTDGALLAWLLSLPEPSKALITTREYRREFRRGGWPVELRGMCDDEALAFAEERLKVLRISQIVGNPAEIESLVVATGGNPKAIEITLGLVKYERRSLQEVVADLYAARGELFEDLFTRAWALLDEAARRILQAMTFFPQSANPQALIAAADVQSFAFDRAVERLVDLALLDVQQQSLNSTLRYAVHPLVRAFAAAQIQREPGFAKMARLRWCNWCVHLVQQVGTCWDDLNRLRLLDPEEETIYSALCWARDEQQDAEIVQLANGVRYYYNVRGLEERRIAVIQAHIAAARRLGDGVQAVRALAELVTALAKQGAVEEAIAAVPELEAAAAATPLPPRTIFASQYALATYWLARGDVTRARVLLEQSLPLSKSLLGQEHILNRRWLGLCLYKEGQLDAARGILEECTRDATARGDQRSIIGNTIWLAKIDLAEQRLEEAEAKVTLCETAAARHYDRRRLSEIMPLRARLALLRGDLPTARAALAEAVDLFRRVGMRRELADAQEELRQLEVEGGDQARSYHRNS